MITVRKNKDYSRVLEVYQELSARATALKTEDKLSPEAHELLRDFRSMSSQLIRVIGVLKGNKSDTPVFYEECDPSASAKAFHAPQNKRVKGALALPEL